MNTKVFTRHELRKETKFTGMVTIYANCGTDWISLETASGMKEFKFINSEKVKVRAILELMLEALTLE